MPTTIFDFMAFDPEKVTSYELGWKGALFDKRAADGCRPVPRQL